MNHIFKTTMSLTVAALLLSGCGENSSDESTDPLPQTVSGKVVDPAIEGSYVKLCLKGNTNSCLKYVAVTDSSGSFSISNIPSGISLNDYLVIASGGVDVETGESFDDLNLTVPVGELTSKTNAVVTPITSLMHSKNWTKAELATELGIPQSDVLKNPSTDLNLQKKAILLTQIAKKSDSGFGVFDTSLDGNITNFINNRITKERTRKELKAISEILETNATTISKVVQNFNAIKTVLDSDVYQENKSSEDIVFTNVKNWAKQILTTLSSNSITTPKKAQYEAILANSNLASRTITTLSDIDINLSNVNLGNIIKENALYTYTIPLTSPLGNVSDKKREYFYKSTASHLAQAENLIKGMNDVSITDTMYVDLAKGYIANNEVERALAYAKNKIFTKENKADVLRMVGEKLIGTNNSKAEALFDEAFTLYKEVTNAKGAGNMKNVDIFDYRYLLKDYSALNLTSKATAVTDYIISKTAEFTTTTQYGSYLVGMNKTAEELIDKGEITEAVKILDDAWDLAKNSPANDADKASSKQHYKAKVYYALSIAQLYVKAGSRYYSKANAIADAMQTLRLDDGNSANGTYSGTIVASSSGNDTSVQTKAYIGDLVDIYAATGEDAKALAVIPTATQTLYVQAGYIEYALGLAKKDNDLTRAFNVIETNIVSYSDKLKALTYNGTNKKGAYIAQYMIENNQKAKAKLAIDKAITILDAAISANQETTDDKKSTNYVKYGYSKFANLYALIGETTLANTYFDKAIAIANGTAATGKITTAVSQVDAMAQIVSHLHEVKKDSDAVNILNSALTIANTISTTKDKLTAMNVLLKSDGEYSNKKSVVDAMNSLIVTSNGLIGESTNDANYKKSIDYLITMSKAMGTLGNKTKADNLLSSAITYANLISVPADKVTKLKEIVVAYGELSLVNRASAVANLITYGSDRRGAIASIAKSVHNFDAFPNCAVATIDGDGDGKPDFYDYGATPAQIASCSLTLDDDSDGDGKPDTSDLTPFYKD